MKQEHSMRSLMMPTCSSKMKIREKSKSRERSCDALPGDMSNTYSSVRGESTKKSSRKGSNSAFGSTLEVRTNK